MQYLYNLTLCPLHYHCRVARKNYNKNSTNSKRYRIIFQLRRSAVTTEFIFNLAVPSHFHLLGSVGPGFFCTKYSVRFFFFSSRNVSRPVLKERGSHTVNFAVKYYELFGVRILYALFQIKYLGVRFVACFIFGSQFQLC